ncbi:HesB/IscA family protein [Tahibacter amnicola]|uniref:Iron-sulfur cluster assembly accessory protein n=1 Tax=Tahibacter amnicola TaxID=2976241 RepID=A0ABY6BBQ7_9GAMM|nr:iron-sulfur cluster assembly accessory protein [Tahibacter amnicola]UXI66982.1 iron-sulfur cluster assembly accessory protein [Tahibacter amnicola]
MAISLTPAARARMQEFLARNAQAVGVRFGVKKTGCSGYSYTVDLADQIAPDDRVYDEDGIKIVIDPKSLPFVDGTAIDFQKSGLNAQFVFDNPNVTGECGCGESFTTN